MHREPDHVKNFILGFVKRVGFVNDQNMLSIEGRFGPQNFELILRTYINEYVRCNECDGFDTILPMENGSFTLRCQQCGSERSVADCCNI
ncbi:hypothetical protein AQUCO_03700198v1 [Aquilegia coerulea]|nr:hypothetical protein AQUCO_03700198v1 [Aquilegia coerulea]